MTVHNANMVLRQYRENPGLFDELVGEFIKFATRKTSKLEDFAGLDSIEMMLNRRGTNINELWDALNPAEAIKEVNEDE
jgi:hypothetical protein